VGSAKNVNYSIDVEGLYFEQESPIPGRPPSLIGDMTNGDQLDLREEITIAIEVR
jgi:hypothetical protein